MRRIMTYARDFDALVMHETQDAALTGNGVMNEGLLACWLGLPGVPAEAEIIPLERDLRLAALTGCRYHAAKISLRQIGRCHRGGPSGAASRRRPACRSTICR